MPGPPIFQVDSFTDEAFRGNPAGVALLEREPPASWMQSFAAEMNLSETAFVWPASNGFNIRWFTPESEVPLCGHATLASAHVLWHEGLVSAGAAISFHATRHELSADADGDWIRLDFPSDPVEERLASETVTEVLSVDVQEFWSSRQMPLALLVNERGVRELTPDFAAMTDASFPWMIVTAAADGELDFVSRFFAPGYGVDEDPVTGAAHTVLAPFWAERLGKSELTAWQASQRGGLVQCKARGSRVDLLGKAVTVFSGRLSEAASPPAAG